MIEAIHLTKRYGKSLALNDVNFTAEEGKLYAIAGTVESGRSTFLKVLAGIFKPDIGEALINGENIYENQKIMRQLFFMPEDMYFPKGRDFCGIEYFYHGYYPAWNHTYYLELLEKLELDESDIVSDLLAEDRRLAAWCCALASGARYLFLDGAFRNVTPRRRAILANEISMYIEQENACAVLSVEEADRFYTRADWYGRMEEGSLQKYPMITQVEPHLAYASPEYAQKRAERYRQRMRAEMERVPEEGDRATGFKVRLSHSYLRLVGVEDEPAEENEPEDPAVGEEPADGSVIPAAGAPADAENPAGPESAALPAVGENAENQTEGGDGLGE